MFSNRISKNWTRCQWLTPVILATQEAEIRRFAVGSQPMQVVCETPSQKYLTQKDWWSGSRCRPQVQASILQKEKNWEFKLWWILSTYCLYVIYIQTDLKLLFFKWSLSVLIRVLFELTSCLSFSSNWDFRSITLYLAKIINFSIFMKWLLNWDSIFSNFI
jgi:hypothetical protein